ncbi:DUF4767 domain-containing protein [Enterococcus sp. 669A]|uniref:DUF4767 domain-containing protein n=1 Tax=Candidatus Enterococcus moelleringii TaxID=2815325 RepID=A0ABS3LD76_9ENTE|nr:DUF4767 domain-containing protein [Enterococcus sp. 669A]MBO1307595.1 DUF4767 domain-containing protein [Enterococcus sp. 669A]
MKRVMVIIASVLFLLAGCTTKSTGTDDSQTFEKYVTQAEKLVKEKDYPGAIEEYDKALAVDTKQDKQLVEDDKAGVNLLITVNKLMDDENYKKVIERLGSSDLRKSEEVIVHKELEDIYQDARKKQQEQWESGDSQPEESTESSSKATPSTTSLWNAEKGQALEGFMAQWGSGMGQQYENYSNGATGDFYGMSIPNQALERAAIDGKKANLALEKNVTSNQGRHLVAVYSDAAHSGYMNKHLYLFVVDQGQPKVYVTMQNQGNSENLLYFEETENQDLKNGFAAIVANTKGYQATPQASKSTAKSHLEINQAFLDWAVERGAAGGMAVSSRYFTHGAAGIGDWYAQTIDGDIHMQDNGHPGAAAFDLHNVGGCVFYTSLDGTVGLDQKAEGSSTAENYYINLDRSQPVHVYLLGDNGQVYEYIYTPDNEAQLGGLFGELDDDGTKGKYAPTKTFAISNDNDARAKLKELLGN